MTKLVFLPLALLLGGCSSIGFFERNTVSRADTIPVVAPAPATVGTIPVAAAAQVDPAAAEARAIAALLLPEGAGAITKIREKNLVNGTRQEIVLAADRGTYGENVIDVSIRTSTPGAKHVNPMQIGPPSESGIRNEILSRFPDVQMNIVTRTDAQCARSLRPGHRQASRWCALRLRLAMGGRSARGCARLQPHQAQRHYGRPPTRHIRAHKALPQ